MSENPRHDSQLLALLEAQGRARVAKVMEPLMRESRCFERGVEAGAEPPLADTLAVGGAGLCADCAVGRHAVP